MRLLPFETCHVTFLVNRQINFFFRGGEMEGEQIIKVVFLKNVRVMVLIKSYAEWQNHCSFYAVVVVSVARGDQVEKRRGEKNTRDGRRETDNNPEDISQEDRRLRQEAFWRKWGERHQQSYVGRLVCCSDSCSFFHQGSRSCCLSRKLIMLFRFRWVPLS